MLMTLWAVHCRKTTRTAFVICPKSNCWYVLCRRGKKAAFECLQKLLVEWQTCQDTAGQPDAQHVKTDGSVETCASASAPDAAMSSAGFTESTQAAADNILAGPGLQFPTNAATAAVAGKFEQESAAAGRLEQPTAAVKQLAAQGQLADGSFEIEESCRASSHGWPWPLWKTSTK